MCDGDTTSQPASAFVLADRTLFLRLVLPVRRLACCIEVTVTSKALLSLPLPHSLIIFFVLAVAEISLFVSSMRTVTTGSMMGAQRQRTTLSVLVLLFLLIDGSIADALQVSLAKKNSNTKGSKWNRSQTQVNTNHKQTCAIRVKHQERVYQSKLSQTVDTSSDLVSSDSGTSVNKQATKHLALVVTTILTVTTSVSRALASVAKGIGTAFRRSWWCLPMLLAVVPLYSSVVLGTPASMPSWWPLTRMDHIFKSPYAKLIIGIFLGSNISYFISGSYLLLRETGTLAHATLPKTLKGYPLLGVLVLAAGSVSTAFHSVQALGCFQLANVLCYIDHAVAISAIFYFWHRCGKPSRTTAVLSAVGLGTLVVAGPHYAWLHSAWHLLSASAAVVWAQDGYAKRLASMELPQEIVSDDPLETFSSP